MTASARVRELRASRKTTRSSSGCGVSVKGAIVIARYGESWRGIKPKVAAEHGAVGCLIYSDPRDDGYCARRRVSRRARCATPTACSAAASMDMPVHPGDPLTPGVGATPDAKRLDIKDARDPDEDPGAADLVRRRAAAARGARGAAGAGGLARRRCRSPITSVPGPATVHLKVAFNWDIKPLYDVIARIQGSTYPDEWIVRGNHHDAWVNGAGDPVSGMAPELEEARALGELREAGLAAEADASSTRRGTARSRGCSARPNGSSSTPRSCGSTPSSTSTPTATAAASSMPSGSHTLERFINGVAQGRRGSRDEASPSGSGAQAHAIATGTADEREEARDARRPAHRRARLGVRLHAVPAAPRRRRR